MSKRRWAVALIVGSTALASVQDTHAQLSYSRGQNMSPAFEGWEQNEDGSFSFLFGYMNRNWEEELDIPVGPDNNIEPGGPDQGQPTHFLPRRNRFVFRVRVPQDFGKKELVWTLTVRGKTEKAYATLRQDYFVDDLVQASEQGALGAGASSPAVRANKAPQLAIEGAASRQIRVGESLSLVALATDDGVPKPRRRAAAFSTASSTATPPAPSSAGESSAPRSGEPTARRTEEAGRAEPGSSANEGRPAAPRINPAWRPPAQITVGSATGLRVSWFVYRGAGRVTFTPEQVKVWEDTRAGANSPWAPRWMAPAPPPDDRWEMQVTFDEPGTYVLRCLASDGAIGSDRDITVTVSR